MDKQKQNVATAETPLDGSLNLNKRKLNDTSDEEKKSSNKIESTTTPSSDTNKKLKPFVALKPKIQLKLASSSTLSTKTSETIKTESIKSIPPKLPTGNLAPSSNSTNKQPPSIVKNDKIAKVFGSDDDEDNDTEEMPLEAKMKMKNVGRNTPTSTGPNSYGKTALGFCDSRALFEKQLKERAEQLLREEEETGIKK